MKQCFPLIESVYVGVYYVCLINNVIKIFTWKHKIMNIRITSVKYTNNDRLLAGIAWHNPIHNIIILYNKVVAVSSIYYKQIYTL